MADNDSFAPAVLLADGGASPEIKPDPFAGKTLPELLALRESGRRNLRALEYGHLADMRVSQYEPYAPDSFGALDRNEAKLIRLRGLLRLLDAAIAKAEGR